ncbi:porin [Candidatus Methylopumilus planktonicus]|uniref:porin n=1 Tax=Candidatus Methylopumilus planktonicus TaxID=1581557 RepID=UPI003BEEE74D
MNKNIKLAVAGAILAAASVAQAGIIIPAGDWTVDIGGNVNTFATMTKYSGSLEKPNQNQLQTGLLPSAFGVGAKTRQNDLDVAVQFSFFTGANANGGDNLNGGGTLAGTKISNGGLGYNSLNIRQAFLSFGDKSWGSFKLGRDLGIFGSDAILSDMTLLGVGSGAGSGGSSTLGRIGSGYIYADWLAQIAYTTPNFNGLEATVGVHENLGTIDNKKLGYSGKASYSFAANDVTGKVWVGATHHKIQDGTVTGLDASALPITVAYSGITDITARGAEIGGKLGIAGAELVGYYYDGKNMDSGIGTAINTLVTNGGLVDRDNNGGYVQATYILPFKTKIGASWGKNTIEKASSDVRDAEREAWVVGAYHPLTKHLNLVAEYNHLEVDAHAGTNGKAKTASLGAILFF